MRAFAAGSFSLQQAPRRIRLIYAGFLLLASLGFLTQLGVQCGRIGLTPAAIAAYYRGGESGDTMTFPKTFGQLLEVTHAHAFVMALIFLVLAHLFVATAASDANKVVVLVVTFAGTVGDLLAPWAIRYLTPRFAWFALASWAALGAGTAAMMALSAWACLRPELCTLEDDSHEPSVPGTGLTRREGSRLHR